jgi:multidrug efflux system membrane fusion protein
MPYRHAAVLVGFALTVAFLAGCERRQPKVGPAETPVIPVSQPLMREVTDYVEFTGRTEAVEAVDVRARVTGYLNRMPFTEGSEVKEGDLLFEIDPRPYQAQYEQALGQVKLYESSLTLAKITYARDLDIARTPGAVSQQQLDQDRASVQEAEARVNAYKASLDVYKLNLQFTKVRSPIDGKISRYYLTKGNLVIQDQTLLTTVVSLDPVHVYFDMDEPTLLRIRSAINAGMIQSQEEGQFFVDIGLQTEEGYPHTGVVNFFNNQVNPNTGSISVRAQLANPRPLAEIVTTAATVGMLATPHAGGLLLAPPVAMEDRSVLAMGVRLFSPGMFVRVRLPIGQPHPAMLVIDRAIASEQGIKYVNVVDRDNKVQQRRVKTGALEPDGRRVIEPGTGTELRPEDWVVVGALQQVRPKMIVQTERLPTMPTFGQPVVTNQQPDKKGK